MQINRFGLRWISIFSYNSPKKKFKFITFRTVSLHCFLQIFQTHMADLIDMTSVYNNISTYPSSNGWNYSMRRNMQEIIPGVYLGPYSSALKNCRLNLLNNNITHIICVRQNVEAHFVKPQFNEPIFKYLILDIADAATESIIKHFPTVRQFIDDALSKNSKVLVHSYHGNSRSATLVLAYVMEKLNLTCKCVFFVL